VIGDVLFETFHSDLSGNKKRKSFGYNYLIPSIIIGTLLIISGVLYEFPRYLLRESLSWVIYSLGINIVLISLLLSVEVFEIIKTKKSYKLFFYFFHWDPNGTSQKEPPQSLFRIRKTGKILSVGLDESHYKTHETGLQIGSMYPQMATIYKLSLDLLSIKRILRQFLII
jgi:hypothetical protein